MKIRRLTRRDRAEWVLDYYEGSRRVRRWYKSKSLAEAAVGDIKHQHRQTGQSWIELAPEERNDIMVVANEARQRNVTIRQIWEAYKSGKLDAEPLMRRTLGQAITETMEWRRGENLRERYLKELENYLRRFAAGRMEMFVDRIGVAEIQSWFAGRKEALSTRRSNVGRLGSLFDVMFKKGYIASNPCLRLPTVKLDQKAPMIFTPKQVRTMLRICRRQSREMLPYVVLGTFAGVRPEELEKLRWRDIDQKHGTVTVDAAASKTNRRRVVHLHKTALAWLKVCKAGKPDAHISPTGITLRRWRRKLRDAVGLWGQDILRHSAGSYLLALHRNAHEVATMLGNSPRILETHYKDLVNATNCAAFWSIKP
jgi:integrase